MSAERTELIESLGDRNERHNNISSQIKHLIALQIRLLREEQGLTQAELGERAGMKQVRISQLEDPTYSGPSINTLKRLAEALDVALVVRFVPFSELVDWTSELSQEALVPKSFEHDARLRSEGVTQASNTGPRNASVDVT